MVGQIVPRTAIFERVQRQSAPVAPKFYETRRHSRSALFLAYGIRRCGYHTPLDRFSLLDISTVGTVSVLESSELEASRRELPADVSFGIGTLLVVEQPVSLKPLQGGVVHTVVYGEQPTLRKIGINYCKLTDT